MKLSRIIRWLDGVLDPGSFDDVSNNGVQIAAPESDVKFVAFGVDASLSFMVEAVRRGAGLCVVHHGISWGGGIKRIDGGVGEVVRAAILGGTALYASHLPLDAHRKFGNNAGIARRLGLVRTVPAFEYHGNIIGLAGIASKTGVFTIGDAEIALKKGEKVGVCSGGAGEFAEDAKKLGCDLFVTGEASWGDVVAARNCSMKMVCAGHYETEVFGVESLAAEMAKSLGVKTAFIRENPRP